MIVFAVLAHRAGKIVTAVGYNRQVFVCGFHEIYLRISVLGYTGFHFAAAEMVGFLY